MQVFFFSK